MPEPQRDTFSLAVAEPLRGRLGIGSTRFQHRRARPAGVVGGLGDDDGEGHRAGPVEDRPNQGPDSRRANEPRQQRQRVSQAVGQRGEAAAEPDQTGLTTFQGVSRP